MEENDVVLGENWLAGEAWCGAMHWNNGNTGYNKKTLEKETATAAYPK